MQGERDALEACTLGGIMTSRREEFWEASSFAFVGNSAKKGFPLLSYSKCKQLGKKAFAIDPSRDRIAGDPAFRDFDALPEKVAAAVLEVPREDTEEWVKKAADAGVERVWIHVNRDTAAAVAAASARGVQVLTGACAVMYVSRGPSVHAIHKLVAKLTKRY